MMVCYSYCYCVIVMRMIVVIDVVNFPSQGRKKAIFNTGNNNVIIMTKTSKVYEHTDRSSIEVFWQMK